jgi:hypothetical protein
MKQVLFVLLVFVSATSKAEKEIISTTSSHDNTAVSENFVSSTASYYSKCMTRYKTKNYIDLNAKCSCESQLFPRQDLSFLEKRNMCKKFNVKEGYQIVAPDKICSSNRELKGFIKGTIIQQYKRYEHQGWVLGVQKKDKSNLWKINKVSDDGVEVELVKGAYFKYKKGDLYTFSNTPLYQRDFPASVSNQQISQSFLECIEPEL